MTTKTLMIKLELTNYQAIQLDSLLQTLSLLTSKTLPDSVKQELTAGFSNNSDLKVVAEKLRVELMARLKSKEKEGEDESILVEIKRQIGGTR